MTRLSYSQLEFVMNALAETSVNDTEVHTFIERLLEQMKYEKLPAKKWFVVRCRFLYTKARKEILAASDHRLRIPWAESRERIDKWVDSFNNHRLPESVLRHSKSEEVCIGFDKGV
ncbi:hypothetical protein [Vibrio phage Va2]|nr:hypothetical protein [Vibrio phage Va2]